MMDVFFKSGKADKVRVTVFKSYTTLNNNFHNAK